MISCSQLECKQTKSLPSAYVGFSFRQRKLSLIKSSDKSLPKPVQTLKETSDERTPIRIIAPRSFGFLSSGAGFLLSTDQEERCDHSTR